MQSCVTVFQYKNRLHSDRIICIKTGSNTNVLGHETYLESLCGAVHCTSWAVKHFI